ncbi:MAG: glycosyltransferase [Bifidobacteriaceae bacterium]|nr:glycosyltransferase [Bifidobacteriaceae bacterium]
MPSLDVLIPFWGSPDLLMESIASVRAQTDPDWRLTVVDDCYPDQSVSGRVEALGDERITYLRNEHNLGPTGNYDRCVKLSDADVVVLMGCDDLMLPTYVATVRRALTRFPDATIIQPGAEVVDEHGRVVRPLVDRAKRALLTPKGSRPTELRGEAGAVSLLRGDWLYWPALAFRREVFGRVPFRPGFPIIQDLAFVVDVIAAGGTLVYWPELAFRYRRHSGSASAKTIQDGTRFEGEGRYYRLAARLMARRGWRRAARVARHHWISRGFALSLLPGTLLHGYAQGARVLARHALGLGPARPHQPKGSQPQ